MILSRRKVQNMLQTVSNIFLKRGEITALYLECNLVSFFWNSLKLGQKEVVWLSPTACP